MGAILTIGWYAVGLLVVPQAVGTVVVPPQDSFTAQYPSLTLTTNPNVDKNCGDFFDQDDAQKYYIAQGGPSSDPDELDLDNDGEACENFVFSTSQELEPNDQS